MDRDAVIGTVGTLASFSMESVHLIAASLAGIFTAIHMGLSIWLRIKGKDKGGKK